MLPEWTRELSQRRGTPCPPKLQHYWNRTISLFSVINRTLVGRVLPLCRDTVSGFYSPNWLGNRILVVGDGNSSADMLFVYSTASADWAIGYSLRGVLPLCRDAVGVFYSLSWLGNKTLVEGSLITAEMQSVYSTASADWAIGHSLRGVLSLQRCSRCILQPQLTGPQDTRWWESYLCRDAVGVFYSLSWLGNRTLVVGSFISAEMQSVNSTASADWAIGHSLRGV